MSMLSSKEPKTNNIYIYIDIYSTSQTIVERQIPHLLKTSDRTSTARVNVTFHQGSVAEPLQSRSHVAKACLRVRVTTHFLTEGLHELIKGAVHPQGTRAVGSQVSWSNLSGKESPESNYNDLMCVFHCFSPSSVSTLRGSYGT